ncbi:SsgA family sporulation/cell division regulator [Streptomyces sp. NBC_01465]|uniref:SsgA family sporulation/cell division regulator n=1 Tax=Streptomyces sp. NBC_01465 TaxID=2903878 RepID=UPI002E307C5F|nr:SsgA family sporulation/cell division regulator [Streptomyces sp. NBC_01465]
MPADTVVEQAVRARMIASAPRMETVPATLRYARRDPFAVQMAFPASATLAGTAVCWTFSRELLEAGVRAPAGLGDVRIRPYGDDRTVLEFHAGEGVAMVHLSTPELRRFLGRAESLVPRGCEHLHLDLDQDVARLLRDAH